MISSRSRCGQLRPYANRLKTVTFQGNLVGTYTYVLVARLRQDGHHQLIQRVVTNSGAVRAGCAPEACGQPKRR